MVVVDGTVVVCSGVVNAVAVGPVVVVCSVVVRPVLVISPVVVVGPVVVGPVVVVLHPHLIKKDLHFQSYCCMFIWHNRHYFILIKQIDSRHLIHDTHVIGHVHKIRKFTCYHILGKTINNIM